MSCSIGMPGIGMVIGLMILLLPLGAGCSGKDEKPGTKSDAGHLDGLDGGITTDAGSPSDTGHFSDTGEAFQDAGEAPDSGEPEVVQILPLPFFAIQSGESRTLDLSPRLLGLHSQSSVTLTATASGPVDAHIDGDGQLHIQAHDVLRGRGTITLTARSTGDRVVSREMGYAIFPKVIPSPRLCTVPFRFDPQGTTYTEVAISTEVRDWSMDDFPMSQNGDIWEGEAELPAGQWGYKFVANRGEWLLDPHNPYRKIVDDTEMSVVVVPDCSQPLFNLVEATVDPVEGTASVEVAVFGPVDGDPIAEESLEVTRNRLPLSAEQWSLEGERLSISVQGLAPGKHQFSIGIQGAAGNAFEPLLVPLWVEEDPWIWRDAIIYSVLVDRFRNGDPANDNPACVENGEPNLDTCVSGEISNWMGGDYAGILQTLREGYFEDLGVNVLLLSNPAASSDDVVQGADGRTYSAYHGHFPNSPDQVESRFGSLELLQELVAEAHSRGIRVVYDHVLNHVYQTHPYWTGHQNDGWFSSFGEGGLCHDDQNLESNPLTCWFEPYLPALDQTNPQVLDALTQDAVAWITRTSVDGFGISTVQHMPQNMGLSLRVGVDWASPTGHFFSIGESLVGEWGEQGGQHTIRRYVRPFEFDGKFDYPLYWEIIKTLARQEHDYRNVERVLSSTSGLYGDWAVMGNFLGNRDTPRFISHAAGDIEDLWGNEAKEQAWNEPPPQPTEATAYRRLKLAMTLLMGINGAPVIYYGDEIGLAGAGDPDNRRMMSFEDLNEHQEWLKTQVSLLAKARSGSPALRRGTYRTLRWEGPVLVFRRVHGQDQAVVAINRSGDQQAVAAPLDTDNLPPMARFREVLTGNFSIAQNGMLNFIVPAETAVVYLLQQAP